MPTLPGGLCEPETQLNRKVWLLLKDSDQVYIFFKKIFCGLMQTELTLKQKKRKKVLNIVPFFGICRRAQVSVKDWYSRCVTLTDTSLICIPDTALSPHLEL